MTILYPIVLETEESGAVSAYVPGLPVYAAAETHAKAERATGRRDAPARIAFHSSTRRCAARPSTSMSSR